MILPTVAMTSYTIHGTTWPVIKGSITAPEHSNFNETYALVARWSSPKGILTFLNMQYSSRSTADMMLATDFVNSLTASPWDCKILSWEQDQPILWCQCSWWQADSLLRASMEDRNYGQPGKYMIQWVPWCCTVVKVWSWISLILGFPAPSSFSCPSDRLHQNKVRF